MPLAQMELFETATLNPWYLFTAEQISKICNVHRGRVQRAKYAPDTPFRFNKCRPEWFMDWTQRHPELKEDKLEERPVQRLKRANRRK